MTGVSKEASFNAYDYACNIPCKKKKKKKNGFRRLWIRTFFLMVKKLEGLYGKNGKLMFFVCKISFILTESVKKNACWRSFSEPIVYF